MPVSKPTLTAEYLAWLKLNYAPLTYFKFLSDPMYRMWQLFGPDDLMEIIEADEIKTPKFAQLNSYADFLIENEITAVPIQNGTEFPCNRLKQCVIIGEDHCFNWLFLDPSDGNSVWTLVFQESGDSDDSVEIEIERLGESLEKWLEKADFDSGEVVGEGEEDDEFVDEEDG